jgi:hypothetical protein
MRILFSLLLIVLLIFAARLNFFGKPYYRYSKLIIPWHISGVDAEKPVISLSFSYEIEDSKGRRIGQLGDVCYTGDRIFLSFQANAKSWISVFGIDANGIYPLFQRKFSPSLVDKEKKYTLSFELNSATGNEIYYVVAGHENFDFDESIRPHLKATFPQGNSKGPAFSKYQMNLSDIFTQRFIYFQHMNRSNS